MPSLNVALKEWDTVCRALASGRQVILLRKGGISETGTGEFQPAHREFLLFPTFLHQNKQMLKPEAHPDYEALGTEPSHVTIGVMAQVSDVLRVLDRAKMDALDAHHIWTPPLVDMRFAYRPENPLYLLIVRAYRLNKPVTIENTPEYGGCKSWVPLREAIDVSGATPALDDARFAEERDAIRQRLL